MSVWVIADSAGAAAELVTLGRSFDRPTVAFVLDDEAAAAAVAYGASAVHEVERGDGLAGDALAAAVAGAAGAAGGPDGGALPEILLFPMTPDGRDAGARLSARWDRTAVTNAHALEVGGDGALVASTRAASVVVRTAFRGPPPWLAGVRRRAVTPVPDPPATFPAPEPPPAPKPPQGWSGHRRQAPRARVLDRHVVAREGPALDEARVVVTGGQGVGSAESYALVEELARLLGGAAGATRAAVDAGWAPHVAKVGLTGVSVAPEVYLAFGVSGAIQHVVGMTASRRVVAVNTDPYAPIFGVADVGVVGDATAVLARLLEVLRARRGAAQDPR